MASNFKIGLTAETLTSFDELTTPVDDPQWEFRKFRKMAKLGDLSVRGQGPNTIIWNMGMPTPEQIAQLEEFQSDDPIYIQSPKRDDSLGVFEVISNWLDPRQDGSHKAGFRGYRFGLEIEFIVLSEVEGS